jgi:hypothetical protein
MADDIADPVTSPPALPDLALAIWDGSAAPIPAGSGVAITIIDPAGNVWSPAAGAFTANPPDDAIPMTRIHSNNAVLARQWFALLPMQAVPMMGLVIHHPTAGVLWYDPMARAVGSPVASGA